MASFAIFLLDIMKACPCVLCLGFNSLIIMTPLVSSLARILWCLHWQIRQCKEGSFNFRPMFI